MFFAYLILGAFAISAGSNLHIGVTGDPLEGDVYNVADIEWLGLESEYQSLNNLLVDETKTLDLETNFDIVRRALIEDVKQNNKKAANAKKLFLALSTLKDIKCNSLSNIILRSNFNAGRFKKDVLVIRKGKRRVDKIYVQVLEQHSKDCQGIYKRKVAEKVASMDKKLVDYVEVFSEKPIEYYTSDEFAPKKDSNYLTRLHNIIFGWQAVNFSAKPSDVYYTLKVVTQKENDPDGEYLNKIDDEREGTYKIDEKGFRVLYERYVTKPCSYYVNQMKDIFEVAKFEMLSFPIVIEDGEDFYKAWAGFELCQEDGDNNRLIRKTVNYIDEQED